MSPNIVSKSYRNLALFFLPIHVLESRVLQGAIEDIDTLNSSPCLRLTSEYERLLKLIKDCLSSEECKQSLEIEHTRVLHEGPSGPLCPPYESVYKIRYGRKQIAMPGIVADLRKYYSILGVGPKVSYELTEDHMSVELEFAALSREVEHLLREKGDPAAGRAEKLRRDFAHRHLIPLSRALAECIRKHSGHPVLLQLAKTLDALVECETVG